MWNENGKLNSLALRVERRQERVGFNKNTKNDNNKKQKTLMQEVSLAEGCSAARRTEKEMHSRQQKHRLMRRQG